MSEISKFLKLNLPDRDEYFSRSVFENNINKINNMRTTIENITSANGFHIIPLSSLEEKYVINGRIFHIKNDTNKVVTNIFNKEILIYNPNKLRMGLDMDRVKLEIDKIYTIYFINDKCYIYWV